MHGPEEGPRSDLCIREPPHDLLGIGRDLGRHLHPVDPVDVALAAMVLVRRQGQPGASPEQLAVEPAQLPLPQHRRVQVLQLGQAQGRLEVRHPVVPAEVFVHEPPLPRVKAEVAQQPAPLREFGAVHEDHSTFAGGHMLVGIKTHGADVPKRSAGFARTGLPYHLGSILDDFEALLFGQEEDRFHINREVVGVHAENCLRLRGDGRSHLSDVHVEGGIAVDQDRHGTSTDNLRDARNDAERWHDDLVALCNA
mmetsp:Transcript_95372/g.269483  ORF Transcript_95372/g.269483 Transcript_95372/m.269483 type:complete len:253 (+) Transcript_95372:255-1013(+)